MSPVLASAPSPHSISTIGEALGYLLFGAGLASAAAPPSSALSPASSPHAANNATAISNPTVIRTHRLVSMAADYDASPCDRQDVYKLTGVSDPRISPDGTEIAYVVWRVDHDDNSYPSAIWVIGTRRRPPARHRGREERFPGPRWSPDGRASPSCPTGTVTSLPAVRRRHRPKANAERLTEIKEDVGHVVVVTGRLANSSSPAANRTMPMKKRTRRRGSRAASLAFSTGSTTSGGSETARRTSSPCRPTARPAPTRSLKETTRITHPTLSPDGKRIAFASARHEDWDVEYITDIYVVDADGGEPIVLTHTDGVCEAPSWSADGARIAYRYTPGRFDEPRHGQIAVIDVSSRAVTVLTASLDRNCAPYPEIREPIWDGDEIVFAVEDRGNTHLYRVPADGSSEPRLHVAVASSTSPATTPPSGGSCTSRPPPQRCRSSSKETIDSRP